MTEGIGAFSGRHVLAELAGIAPARLDDEPFLRGVLETSLAKAGATVVDVVARRFAPQGVTVLALLAESHASIHTYPELGTAFVDVFTCGDRADPEHAVRLLAGALGAGSVTTSTITRGEG